MRRKLCGAAGFRIRAEEARLEMTAPPKRKRTNSRWPSDGDYSPCDRPDPDDPGGLGAEESGTERTGPTQWFLLAIQLGGRLSEVGPYYDFCCVSIEAHEASATGHLRPFWLKSTCSRAQSARSCRGYDWRRRMDMMSGEADQSEMSAAERGSAANPLAGRVTFNRFELHRILNL